RATTSADTPPYTTLFRSSALAVPMTAGAKTLGALVFVNDPSSRKFDRADVELASEIARRAGVAVENARLASERSEVARVLQRGLARKSTRLNYSHEWLSY